MGLDYAKTIEKWDVLEVTVSGPKEGNPFCDQWIKGTFCCKNEKKTVDGFYDGDGVYKVRFMPSFVDPDRERRRSQRQFHRNTTFRKQPWSGSCCGYLLSFL